jgi:ketosteroid isomerase-like protein
MNDSDRALIERACARLVAAYGYFNDERNFDALADLFADDAVLYRPAAPDQPISGRDAILASFASRPASRVTFHVCTDVLIDVDDATQASGRSRILLLSSGGAAPVPGMFRDRFRLTEKGWKFAERRGTLSLQP